LIDFSNFRPQELKYNFLAKDFSPVGLKLFYEEY